MKIFPLVKKGLIILAVVPFFSILNLNADQLNLVARAEHRQGSFEHQNLAHPNAAHDAARQSLNHPGEFNAAENRTGFNRGVEAGAAEGAAVGGANAAPVYVAPTQPQVQYVLPTQTGPNTQ